LFPLTVKATLPVGVLPYCPATTAENVTAWFTDEELADDVKVICEFCGVTVWLSAEDVLA
jgi:hypothetical protein